MTRQQCVAAAAALSLGLAWSRPLCAADDSLQQMGTMMWVLTVAEYTLLLGAVGLGGAAALFGGSRGSDVGGQLGFGMLGSAAIFGIGAGFASMEGDWDPRIAGAMHQALWAGSGLGALGYLLGQSIDPDTPWPAALAATGLGAIGMLGGAALGGLLVDNEGEVWLVYAAPLVGAASVFATWGIVSLTRELRDQPPLEERALVATLIAAGSAPLLVAALGVGAISVLQAVR